MSVASLINRKDYIGNGNVDTYAYDFKIFSQSDLRVIVRSPTTPFPETVLTIGTHYTVSGVGETAGGNVALVAGAFAWLDAGNDLENNWALAIIRVRTLKQETDFRNQGSFFPELHEDEFDRHTMIEQLLQEQINRSVRLSESYTPASFDPVFPTDLPGSVSKVPITNGFGTGWAEAGDWPTASEIGGAAASAAAAAASAASATASAAAALASEVSAAASAASASQNTTGFWDNLGFGDGADVSFGPLTNQPLNEDSCLVMIDGLVADKSGWALSGLNIIFSAAPDLGQEVSVFYMRRASVLVPGAPAYFVTGTPFAPYAVAAAVSIPVTTDALQRRYVVSSGGAVIQTANPQIAAGSFIGQKLALTGTSDVNYPILDDGTGLYTNGPMNLQNNRTIEFHFNGTLWVEDSRN